MTRRHLAQDARHAPERGDGGRVGRRGFLVGAGGFAVALPFLPSLLRKSRADDAAPLRFVAVTTDHGGLWEEHFYPGDDTLTERLELFPGHVAHHGALSATDDGSEAVVSPVLRAPHDELTPRLLAKLGVVRGCGFAFNTFHHRGLHLGNFGDVDGNPGKLRHRPTIDQVLAWSPRFYADLSGVRQRSVAAGAERLSWTWENPWSARGATVPVPVMPSAHALFDALFGPPPGGARAPGRPGPSVIDRVLASYTSLRDGAFGDARRLSADDRRLLDAYVERLHELDRRLNTALACPTPSRPAFEASLDDAPDDVAGASFWYGAYNETIALGLACGATRVATLGNRSLWSSFGGADWHQQVAHEFERPDAQALLVGANQAFFRHVFLDLVRRLDSIEESDGRTLLDNSLVTWTQEAGVATHDTRDSLPIVTAGGAGGWLRTGRFVDYRDRTNVSILEPDWDPATRPVVASQRPGLLYVQWLSTALQAMGLDPSDYERPGERGYGALYVDPAYRGGFPERVLAVRGDPLPLLRAG